MMTCPLSGTCFGVKTKASRYFKDLLCPASIRRCFHLACSDFRLSIDLIWGWTKLRRETDNAGHAQLFLARCEAYCWDICQSLSVRTNNFSLFICWMQVYNHHSPGIVEPPIICIRFFPAHGKDAMLNEVLPTTSASYWLGWTSRSIGHVVQLHVSLPLPENVAMAMNQTLRAHRIGAAFHGSFSSTTFMSHMS